MDAPKNEAEYTLTAGRIGNLMGYGIEELEALQIMLMPDPIF